MYALVVCSIGQGVIIALINSVRTKEADALRVYDIASKLIISQEINADTYKIKARYFPISERCLFI